MKKILVTIFCVLLTACQTKIIHLNEADNGKKIIVNPEQEIVLELSGNITTGYSWEFVTEESASGIVEELENNYKPDEAPRGRLGVGGVSLYRFRVLKPGKVVIMARYYRPWQAYNPETDKSVKIVIEVE